MADERGERASDAVVLKARLAGARRVPVRLAFAFLSGGRTFWVLAVVCVPLALVVASRFSSAVAGLLVGVPGLFLLAFWWSSYRYMDSRVTIDPGARTLRLEQPDTPAWTRSTSRDLDDVGAVSIVSLAGAAVVRFDAPGFSPLPDVVVSRADLPAAIDALRSSGVDTSRADRTPASQRLVSEPLVRIAVSPILLLGVPLYGVLRFGPWVLVGSNAAVVAWILAVWTAGRHLTHAFDLRPEGPGRGLLFDCVVTGTLLAAALGILVLLLS